MATWQFDFFLASEPESAGRDGFRQIATHGEDRETLIDLRKTSLAIDDLNEITSRLEPLTTWYGDLRQWGSEVGNRIDVLVDGQYVREIFVRVDVRNVDHEFLNSILNLARKHSLVIVTESGKILGALRASLLRAIEASPAFRFVADPVEFLRSISGD